ncbi:MAG: pilus assembly protein PilM [Desulfotalea sp.]
MKLPFFSSHDLVVGIDIGSHAVKICQLKKAGDDYSVVALGSALLPEDAVDDGTLNSPEEVSNIIATLLKNLKIRNKKIGFSISGYSVIVKKINLQAMEDKLLEDYIMAEAEQYIPFDREDVYLDYQDLKTNETPEGRTDVMLVAAKKDVVQEYLTMFDDLGLIPVLVDIDGFAFENSFEHSSTDSSNVAMVDIGASKISINILSEGLSVVARDVVLGSRQITEQIQDLLDLEFEEAELIKLGGKQPEEGNFEIQKIFSKSCTQWVLEIKKSIDLYHANYKKSPLAKIILGGGGAKVTSFAEFLNEETGIKVELCSPFNNISFDEKKIDPEYIKDISPEMAIATGIALRKSVI